MVRKKQALSAPTGVPQRDLEAIILNINSKVLTTLEAGFPAKIMYALIWDEFNKILSPMRDNFNLPRLLQITDVILEVRRKGGKETAWRPIKQGRSNAKKMETHEWRIKNTIKKWIKDKKVPEVLDLFEFRLCDI